MSIKNKILDVQKLSQFRKKNPNKKIVLCHGVFDLLHVGHINYFKSAKKNGEVLVVSITHDKFVNKGPGRPAFKIENRVNFLKEIECVDFIFISNHPTAEKIIKNLKPHFYCKGSDYPINNIKKDLNLKKEIDALRSINGKFKVIQEPTFSSSKFINDNSLQNLSTECKDFIKLIRNQFSFTEVLESVKKVRNKKVLIIGETIIDKYITTEAIGKSGKEPMLVIKPKKEINFLGGSAYIANLCSSFTNNIKIQSFLGDQRAEKKFILRNLNKNIKHDFLIKKNSPTINKLRYIDDYRKTKIIGVYDLNDDLITKGEENKFYKILKKNISKYDIIIVADYGHGIITKKIRDLIIKNSSKIFLNTQINSFNRGYHTVFNYKKINTLVINESELRYELRDRSSVVSILANKLAKKISLQNIIITRGRTGAIIINKKNNLSISCPAFNRINKDTIGAGDTFFALSSLLIGAKIDFKISILIASIAASFSIDQISAEQKIFNSKTLEKYLSHILK
jgi:rfaE bifunctional protein kinase chain/domain/rfaE bifunctional protein nucleotidyltransferase chain/domain